MQCFLCSYSFPQFLHSLACPNCGSLPEHRLEFLFLSLVAKFREEGRKTLAVGASEAELNYLAKNSGNARVTAIDLRDRGFHERIEPPHRLMRMDVTHLAFSDHCFDLILCGGVLPFVRSDFLAMSEMHRCLKGEGLALITVKILLAKTRRASELHGEQPEVFSREFLALRGDEWVYGEDYFERLEAAGIFWHRLRAGAFLDEATREQQAIADELELILCFKYRDEKEKFLKEARLG
ncbi:MAG: class I SAM-dependent methyltransferase [Bdellovibrionota bacterium]